MEKINRKSIREVLYAAELAEIEMIERLPEVEFEHSEKYKNFLSEAFELARKEENRKSKMIKRKTFLIAALIALLALTVTACSVIKPVREFIIEVFEKYTLFTSDNNGESEFIEQKYNLHFIPFGYEISDCFDEDSFRKIVYEKDGNIISFEQGVLSGLHKYDSENTTVVEADIDGKHIYLFTKWKNDLAVWSDSNYHFAISYPEELDFSEVCKMIESVAPIGE